MQGKINTTITKAFYRKTLEYNYSALYLAHRYRDETDDEYDIHRAINLYIQAAEFDITEASFILGRIYTTNIAVRNFDRAVLYYEKGAALGCHN